MQAIRVSAQATYVRHVGRSGARGAAISGAFEVSVVVHWQAACAGYWWARTRRDECGRGTGLQAGCTWFRSMSGVK